MEAKPRTPRVQVKTYDEFLEVLEMREDIRALWLSHNPVLKLGAIWELYLDGADYSKELLAKLVHKVLEQCQR